MDLHDLEPQAFLDEVHSFEFWFQSVEGYLSGRTWGYVPGTADEPLADAEREQLIDLLCNYCVGETAALEASSGLIAIAPNRMTKVFLATQVVDEGRHLEVFIQRLKALGVEDPETLIEKRASRSLKQFKQRLLELVDGKDWESAIFAQNVILESLEFVVFNSHRQTADPITAQVLEGVIKDERRHIGFGENELGRRLAASPHMRARIGEVRKDLDHLILDTLEETARHIGVPRSEQEELGRLYRDSVSRLGLTP